MQLSEGYLVDVKLNLTDTVYPGLFYIMALSIYFLTLSHFSVSKIPMFFKNIFELPPGLNGLSK